MNTEKTEAGEVAALAIKSVTPIVLDQATRRRGLLVFPNGTTRSLEYLDDLPVRPRAAVVLVEAKSFIDYVKKFKDPNTLMFGTASETGGCFNAIIDYHDATSGEAHWGEHTAQLNLVVTPEWHRWLANNDNSMTQEQFSEFLEDNLTDIVKPEAADLLEMAQMLTGTKGVTFKSGKNLKTGGIDFQYTETIEAGGRRDADMKVPDHFVIGLTPFVGSAGVEIKARLRYRISENGKLTFRYLLDHPSKVVEEAFNATRQEIETETTLKVHMGTARVIAPAS